MSNKYELARMAYEEFLDAVHPKWREDPGMERTPERVSKMYIDELLNGEMPKVTFFDNEEGYDGIVFSGKISIKSLCAHHAMPFWGKAYIAYIPDKDGKIVGLSKLNRIVNYFARGFQTQEHLTMQIHNYLAEHLDSNWGVAVYIECVHTCVSLRGAQDDSIMKTAKLSGFFFENNIGSRDEFYNMIKQ